MIHVRAVSTLLTAAAIVVLGCAPPASAPAPAGDVKVTVAPFEVEGQEEGSDYLGGAFAASLAKRLAESSGLDAVVDETASADTPRIHGTLSRDGGAVQIDVRLDGHADGWESKVRSEEGDLSWLASAVARQLAGVLGVARPPHYQYFTEITTESATAAPLVATIRERFRSGDAAGVLEASTELVESHGDDPVAQALHAVGLMLGLASAPSREALVSLRERLEALDRVDPDSPYDELIRGYVYRSSGEPDQALVLYTRVLARNDLSVAVRAWALRQRALAFLQVGNADAARGDAEEAVDLDPCNAPSLTALSKALERSDPAGAATASNRALAIEPDNWRHHQRLGIVYTRSQAYEQAVDPVKRACDLSDAQEACGNVAVILERCGRSAEAAAAAGHAESLTPTRWGLYNLACYKALAGRSREALTDLERAVELGFADIWIQTDPDLDSLRADGRFESVLAGVESRLRTQREVSTSVFPWQ